MSKLLLCLMTCVLCAGQTCTPSSPLPPDDNDGTEVLIYTNDNVHSVSNAPTNDTTFVLSADATITHVRTYHWNSQAGTASPGTISLRSSTGITYGPWSCSGAPGQGGVSNAHWDCYPDASVPAGTYTVIDSDNATWSHNSTSGNAGIVHVYGILSSAPPSDGADALAQAKQANSIFFAFHGEHFYQRTDMSELYPGNSIEINSNHSTYLGTVSAPITWTGNTFRIDYSDTGTYNSSPAGVSIEATGTLTSDGSAVSSWQVVFEESVQYSGGTTTSRKVLKGSGQTLPLHHTYSDRVEYQALGSGAGSYLQTVEDSYSRWDGYQSTYSTTSYAGTDREPWLGISFDE